MKHNTLKKTLSLLLVIYMMASFAGCFPGEENPTDPSTIETTVPTESTAGTTDGTTAPTDSTDATTSPTEESQASTIPTEDMTEPPATEAPNTDPTFATEIPTESPVETFVDEGRKLSERNNNTYPCLRFYAGDPGPDLRSIPYVQPQWHQIKNCWRRSAWCRPVRYRSGTAPHFQESAVQS